MSYSTVSLRRIIAFVFFVLPLLVYCAGCGGDATVYMVNETEGTMEGTIDNQVYQVGPNSETMMKVQVGGGLKSCSSVTVTAEWTGGEQDGFSGTWQREYCSGEEYHDYLQKPVN